MRRYATIFLALYINIKYSAFVQKKKKHYFRIVKQETNLIYSRI